MWCDETSLSVWNPIKRRTWTDGSISLPMQSYRGANRTVLGALFDVDGTGRPGLFCTVAGRTNKESFLDFLQKLLSYLRLHKIDTDNVVLLADNHSAHRAKIVKEYLREQQVTLHFISSYSSPFNVIEHVWSALKSRFAKDLASMREKYNHEGFDRHLKVICAQIENKLTRKILTSNEKYIDKTREGLLI